MEFIKKNLIMVISGIVAILALVMLFLGMSSSGVRNAMEEAQQEWSQISSLQQGVSVKTADGGSVNRIPTDNIVRRMREVSDQYKKQGAKALEKTLKENISFDPATGEIKRKVLMTGIFPKPTSDAMPYKFQIKYVEGIKQLLTQMQAGTIPTAEDILSAKEKIAQENGFETDETVVQPTARRSSSISRTARNQPQPAYTPSYSQTSNQNPQELEAISLAANTRAEKIKVYCDINNLDVIGSVYTSTGNAPSIEDMWWAQLSLWLQQDVVNAISQVNASAKNVTESVVKRVEKITTLHGYMVTSATEGKLDFVGRDQGQFPDSFTGLGSGKYYDVVRLSVTVYIDARRIPEFIDAMYRQGHYLLYMWNIDAVNPLTGRSGGDAQVEMLYVYGEAPVVKLTSSWEGYLLRDFYHWGIVGYDINPKTSKPVLLMYDGTKAEIGDMEERKGLKGLMPKTIRVALGSDQEDPADSSSAEQKPNGGN